MSKLAIKVKKVAEKSILQGHPWVYENSIEKQNKAGETGDLAVIFDQRRNKFMAVGLYDPQSVIRIRILHVGNSVEINKDFFKFKIQNAFDKRENLLQTETTAYRLVYGENDALPGLIIDVYNQIAVIKLYTGIWFPFLEIILEILVEILKIETAILRLNRLLQMQNSLLKDGDIIFGKLENEEITFLEHGLKFKANLIKGHKTGYFLDHRNNRLKIRGLSEGKRVLDIFSYAGGFSVNAIAGGAKEVISLDLSAQALELAKSNVALNFSTTNHSILVSDAFDGIKLLQDQGKTFDLIICDPPSFAKSESQIDKALYSYKKLVDNLLPLIASNGILLMASCSSRIDKEIFYELIIETVKNFKRKFSILEKATHDVDHPEGIKELSYLKAIYLKFVN